VAAGTNGLSAIAGAIGLLTGASDFGADVDARLPFESLPFAGLMLALVVGVPSLALCLAAWRGDRRTEALAVVTGAALVGWIVVQIACIRAFSWFQPTYVAVGLAFAVHGWRGGGRPGQLLARSAHRERLPGSPA
jgi:hypothetical protein